MRNPVNRPILSYCAALTFCLSAHFISSTAIGQTDGLITHTVFSQLHTPAVYGRDLWFTMAENYDAGGSNGKYYMLYVAARKAATIRIQVIGSSAQAFKVDGLGVVAFKIPLQWEVTSSGVPENKGIRVWSEDADLSAYLLSRNPDASDGMYIIPLTGWGKENVVASYASLFDGSVYDYPSEFSVVSNQSDTHIYPIPTVDIRADHQPTKVLHPHGQTFVETLQRGQCVQYQATVATNTFDYDATGTLITSDKPVGVVGASQCSNIPVDAPFCDHLCEMVPPIRTWDSEYYSIPFAERQGGDTFVAVASADNQSIYREDANGKTLDATLSRHEFVIRPGVLVGTRWYSDKPFLLVQYINGLLQPNSSSGSDDPSMVVLSGTHGFSHYLLPQTPTILSGQLGYTNYANVILPKGKENTTLFDGRAVNTIPGVVQVDLPNSYTAFRIFNVPQGVHEIRSDGEVGCYLYGYGVQDSYAWGSAFGTAGLDYSDSIPPVVEKSSSCFCAHIALRDSGLNASKLSSFVVDTVNNVAYEPDPTFLAGSERDSSFYDFCVLDSTKSAVIQVSVRDAAGNLTTITSTYEPQTAAISPAIVNFGSSASGKTISLFDTITNTGLSNFDLTVLKLKLGDVGFSLDSANDTSPLKPGESRAIKVNFTPKVPETVLDTIVFGNACVTTLSFVTGNGGKPDFTVTDLDFGCIEVGDSVRSIKVTLSNPSPANLTLDSVYVDDRVHFAFAGTLPIDLPANTQSVVNVPFTFRPTTRNPHYATAAHFHTTSGLLRSDSLFGCGMITVGVKDSKMSGPLNPSLADWLDEKDKSSVLLLPVRPNPASGNSDVTFTVGLRERGAIVLKLYDLLGKEQATVASDLWHPEGVFDLHLDTHTLAAGSYIYRLEALGEVRSGRLIVRR